MNQPKKVDAEVAEEQPAEASATAKDGKPTQSKRPLEQVSDKPSKKQKADEESEPVQDETNQEVPPNPHFEWYDEIKRVLGKATNQTLGLESIKKKVIVT